MCLVAITDGSEVKTITRLKQHVIEEPAHINLSWLSEKRWIVVPRPSACHFNDADANLLSRALIEAQCLQLFAIATEPLASFPNCFAVTTSKDGLLAFSHECAHFNFVLMPADRSAVILCTVYDYFLVAGPTKFVRRAIGGDIEKAWEDFEREALDPWSEGRLQKVADRYRTFSGSVPQPIP
jgi:hypothetical protein